MLQVCCCVITFVSVCLYHSSRVFLTDLCVELIQPHWEQLPQWPHQTTDSTPAEQNTTFIHITDCLPVLIVYHWLSVSIDLSAPSAVAAHLSRSLRWRQLLLIVQDSHQSLSPARCVSVSAPNNQTNTQLYSYSTVIRECVVVFWCAPVPWL